MNTPNTSPTKRSRLPKVLLVLAVLVVLIVAAVFVVRQLDSEPTTSSQPAPTPTAHEPSQPPMCHADGRFVAGFMSPQADDADTANLVEHMGTDAVTFGGRIVPAETGDYPEEVAEVVGDRQAYEYTVAMNWQGVSLPESDTVVQVGTTQYGVVQAGDNSVVITESVDGADVFHSLTRVSGTTTAQALIGLPVPQMRSTWQPWLPDHDYAPVVDGFAQKFVTAYHQRGAHGFYLAMEMPLTDAEHWSPVTDYYARQTAVIHEVAPGATVLISPYLEGRTDREMITPATAAKGYQKLLDLSNGTNLVVSPQDGLGVGTTALETDESAEHTYTVEDYFEALHEVNSQRLYVTIEAMTPGGGTPETRGPTTPQRVQEQLSATAPFVQGAIAFQWSGPNAVSTLEDLGQGACAAGFGKLP